MSEIRNVSRDQSPATKCATTGPGYQNQELRTLDLMGESIAALVIDGKERLCLAQISNTLLRAFSYNEIHNRRVALGITCLQCTPVQLEILRRAGAMPVSSRRCGLITRREAERLCKSFLSDEPPMRLPDNFSFEVEHSCGWGCQGNFIPSRYNSSRAKCVQCLRCSLFFSPNKFIFHSHRNVGGAYVQPDAANFNAWRRHLNLTKSDTSESLEHAWEEVKAMFNGGSRKRVASISPHNSISEDRRRIENTESKNPSTEVPESLSRKLQKASGSGPLDLPLTDPGLLSPFSSYPFYWPYSPLLFPPSSPQFSSLLALGAGAVDQGPSPRGFGNSSLLPSLSSQSETSVSGDAQLDSTAQKKRDDLESLSKAELSRMVREEREKRQKAESELKTLKDTFLQHLQRGM